MLIRKIVYSCVVVFLFLFSSSSLFAADGLIKKVVFHGKIGGSESVVFYLNGPWLPKAFALKGEKPRVVFDFLETGLARTVPSSIETSGDMIRKIRIGRHSNKTRVVMDLTAGGSFNFDQNFDESENILTIQLFPADSPEIEKKLVIKADQEKRITPEPVVELKEETVSETIIVVEPNQEIVEVVEIVEEVKTVEEVELVAAKEIISEETTEVVVVEKITPEVKDERDPALDPLLDDVSFENTSSKGEMVLFTLNGFYPPTVSGEEEGTPLVICDFAGTRIGEKVVRELATHGEYIERVSVKQLNDSDLIRVTLELVPNKNYDLQQVFFKEDNLFVIIVNTYKEIEVTEDTKE